MPNKTIYFFYTVRLIYIFAVITLYMVIKKKHLINFNNQSKDWDLVIKGHTSLFDINFKDVWNYRDLLFLFVKRDFVTVYKQTILGPLWFFIQPLLTTITFTIVFGTVAQLSTDGAPKMIFYLAGITLWTYFSGCLMSVSSVFNTNASIFGKVYFPRLIMPLTVVISNLMKFGVQFILFLGFVFYFFYQGKIQPNFYIILMPLIIFLMAAIALGIGLILTAMTTKYKDLNQLITFGVQLFMYVTPVIYPSSSIPDNYKWIVDLNPLVSLFDYMRFAFLGIGKFSIESLLFPAVFSIAIVAVGILIFNKTQKTFIDTV
ncbi:ABC transporter permease [Flavobacterium capsici]|uniref:Transport permease protein n=1 Tax=Flavobacterium capsici TaxID=3075618 RepID=A0AA96EZP8_9FLAO|nr:MULTISPECIES: ABC transporter permease [unclassified Flavobacterium]WNM20243.1 ABC transporter permease [Flavobacterium sp. PMR2A8]WNM21633.1 ABC transporter permease [Flavobacterium sp. PMTSA4]